MHLNEFQQELGTQRSLWDASCRFDYPNPEYR